MGPSARKAPPLTRGRMAALSGCNAETIRYYERIGLMPDPGRTAAGYRIYEESHLKRISFIRRLRSLGFTLDEIRRFLALVDAEAYTCKEVLAISREHIDVIRAKISDLERMKNSLEELVEQCTGDEVPNCPIVDQLYDAKRPD